MGNNRLHPVLSRAALLFVDLTFLCLILFLLVGEEIRHHQATLGICLAILFLFSAALALLLPLSWSRALGIHGLLVLGAILFMFPFLWLLTTSFKYPEEVVAYPPRWIPAAPVPPVRSPFVTAELFPEIVPPDGISAAAWPQLKAELESRLWSTASGMLDREFLCGLEVDSVRSALFQALWDTLTPAIPADIWKRDPALIPGEIVSRITPDRLEDAWNGIYRCTAVRDFFVTDMERRDHPIVGTECLAVNEAMVATENIRPRVLPIQPGAKERMLQLAYSFETGSRAAVLFDVPLPIPEESFLSITLPIRMDRSWHHLDFALEMGGKRYESHNPLFLNRYRWQELTFKLADRDPSNERDLGIWPLYPSAEPAHAPKRPGYLRVIIELRRASLISAVWNKYIQNYRDAWFAGEYWPQYITNSVYLVVMTVLGQLISCSMVAYAFSRLRWPGRDFVFVILLGTMMLPGQVSMIPVFLIFRALGWYNTLRPLWLPAFTGAAFFIFLLRQFMKGIPRELEEAALIDGCGYFGIYRRIMLPLIKPALAAVAIFTFMGTWNEFMGPLIYLSDQRLYPLALGLFEFRAVRGGQFGLLMAASTLMILPVIAIFFMAQRYFIQGVTLTGLKN